MNITFHFNFILFHPTRHFFIQTVSKYFLPSGKSISNVGVMPDIKIEEIGIRPGEKIDEILLSEEECLRTSERNGYYVINTILPVAKSTRDFEPVRTSEYTSAENLLSMEEITELLVGAGYLD